MTNTFALIIPLLCVIRNGAHKFLPTQSGVMELTMRIIAGTARGKKLTPPLGDAIRPTADMVKESIFNIIQFEIEGRRVLDLFAGSGQLGIEALSRGAAEVIFVDQSGDACRLIKQNLEAAKFTSSVVKANYQDYLRQGMKPFHLVFVDPPYSKNILPKALEQLCEVGALSPGAVVVVEASKNDSLPEKVERLRLIKLYSYGKTSIGLYRYGNEDRELSGEA